MRTRYLFLFIAVLSAPAIVAAVDTTAKLLPREGVLVLSAPPRENLEEGNRTYQPIAEYLSKATGKRIVYEWPPTWGVYRTKMVLGTYDLVFDGPHFNGYRIDKLKHEVLAKLQTPRDFVIFVRKNDHAKAPADLTGKMVCTQAPPNLGALVLLSLYKSNTEPLVVPIKGFESAYDGVISGRCQAGVIPAPTLAKMDKGNDMRVIYKTDPMPDQAFSASPRVSKEDQIKIASALTGDASRGPTERLRARFQGGDRMIPAESKEYVQYGQLLRSQWGFYE